MIRPLRTALMVAIVALSLVACGGRGNKAVASADLAASKVTTIGVNAYLWRATLDTITFIAGEALADDIRAEIDLLRAELDMLKRAFRRHCVETM